MGAQSEYKLFCPNLLLLGCPEFRYRFLAGDIFVYCCTILRGQITLGYNFFIVLIFPLKNFLLQPYRLGKRTVASNIPNFNAHPFTLAKVKGQGDITLSEFTSI